jgi:hypothetical protein
MRLKRLCPDEWTTRGKWPRSVWGSSHLRNKMRTEIWEISWVSAQISYLSKFAGNPYTSCLKRCSNHYPKLISKNKNRRTLRNTWNKTKSKVNSACSRTSHSGTPSPTLTYLSKMNKVPRIRLLNLSVKLTRSWSVSQTQVHKSVADLWQRSPKRVDCSNQKRKYH